MNKYRSEMEKITVTPEMEERILKNLSNKTAYETEIKKQSYLKWIRPVSVIAACFVIVIGVMFTFPSLKNSIFGNPQSQTPQEGQILIPNPIVETDGVEELKKSVSFDLLVPGILPEGYKIESTSVISGKLAQIIYSNGSSSITFRAAKGDEDISGDYTSYEESHTAEIGGAMVTLKGSKSLVSLAVWTKDDCSYSLSFSAGVDKETAVNIIESIKKA